MKSAMLKIIMISLCYMYIGTCNIPLMGQDQQAEQDALANELLYIEIAGKLLNYNKQLYELQKQVQRSTPELLNSLDKRITSIDLKWNLYNQSNQLEIANNDSLLQIATDFQLIKQELTDSIMSKRHLIESREAFKDIEILLFSQDTIYAEFYNEAKKYEKVKKLAPSLEKLKIKEQLVFTNLQENYEKAKAIAAEFPILEHRAQLLENKYIEIKNSSDKIQAMEYKSLFQRIKDYLMGLAAVSMILMFGNVIQTKLKAWKQAKESAKKLKEMMQQNDNEYPTI